MKRGAEDDGDSATDNKRRQGNDHGAYSSRSGEKIGPYCFKVLCQDGLAANIIGSGGSTKKQIEDDTGATLKITKRDEFYPDTYCRILLASADEPERIEHVLEQVVSKIVEVAEKEMDKGKGKGYEDQESLFGKEPGEFVFRGALPAPCTRALIRNKGEAINELRERSGAKLFVENEFHEGHNMVRVIGGPDTINYALRELCAFMTKEVDEGTLMRWAPVMLFPGAKWEEDSRKGGGKGKKGGGKSKDKGWERSDRGGRRDNEELDDDEEQLGLPPDFNGAPLDAIGMLVNEFGEGRLDMAHCIRCDLPNEFCGPLIGKRGKTIKTVERLTGTEIAFDEAPKNADVPRCLTITGPLVACYAAHMMMMKRYHDHEEKLRREQEEAEQKHAHVENLQSQIEELERQLHEAKGRKKPARGK